jgi:hypothetical protein
MSSAFDGLPAGFDLDDLQSDASSDKDNDSDSDDDA